MAEQAEARSPPRAPLSAAGPDYVVTTGRLDWANRIKAEEEAHAAQVKQDLRQRLLVGLPKASAQAQDFATASTKGKKPIKEWTVTVHPAKSPPQTGHFTAAYKATRSKRK